MPNTIQPGEDLTERVGTRWVVAWKAFYIDLCNANGNRYSLVLYRNDDGSWNRNYNHLDNDRNDSNLAAVLANLFISPLTFVGGVLFVLNFL